MYDLPFEAQVEQRTIVPRFKSFYGSIIEQMPLLVAEGRELVSPKFVMSEKVRKIDGNKSTELADQVLLRNNYVDTSAIAIADPSGSGEVIVALSTNPVVRSLVYALSPKTKVVGGSVETSKDVYEAIKSQDAFVIGTTTANNLRNGIYNEQKAREGFFDYVAEGDSKLTKDHLKLVQKTTNGGAT